LVGPKDIPADKTRTVIVLGDHLANEAIYDAVDVKPELLKDTLALKHIQDSLKAADKDIQTVHEKVRELAEAPLVPDKPNK